MESNQPAQKRAKRIMQHENRLREFSDSMKHNNIYIIGIPEEEREKGTEILLEEIIVS